MATPNSIKLPSLATRPVQPPPLVQTTSPVSLQVTSIYEKTTAYMFLVTSTITLCIAAAVYHTTAHTPAIFQCAHEDDHTLTRSTSHHTLHLATIPLVAAIGYFVLCANTAYKTRYGQFFSLIRMIGIGSPQPRAANSPASATLLFTASILVIPILYRAGIRCIPDLAALVTIYLLVATCWVFAQISSLYSKTRFVVLVVLISTAKVGIIVAKIRSVDHMHLNIWFFLVLDAIAGIVYFFISQATSAHNPDDDHAFIHRSDIIHTIAQLHYLSLFALSTAACFTHRLAA